MRRLVPAAAVSAAVAGASNACVSAAKCEDTEHAGEVTGGAPADGPAGKAEQGGNPLWPGQLASCIRARGQALLSYRHVYTSRADCLKCLHADPLLLLSASGRAAGHD